MENVALFVFKLDRTIRLVLDELALQFGAICHCDFATLTSTLVLEPFTFVNVAIGVEHHALQLAAVVLHGPLVELSVDEEDLDVAVLQLPSFKATLYDFIGRAEQNSLALWVTFAPLTFVDGSVCELTQARAVSEVVLPASFVDVTVGEDHLALTVLESL